MKKQPIIKDGTGYFDRNISNYILPTLPFWHISGCVPNTLTTLGLICSILSLVFFYKCNKIYSLIFLLLRWYFDYADGMLARKYDQVTVFGDWYDHITDWIYFIGFGIILFIKSNYRMKHMSIFFISIALFSIQFGCMEKENRNNSNIETSISRLRYICIKNSLILLFDNSVLYLVMINLLCNTV